MNERLRADLPVQLLRLLALTAVATAVVGWIIHWPFQYFWPEAWYLLLVVAALAVSLRKPPLPESIPRPGLFWQWGVFLAVLGWRLSRITRTSVWLDEDFQVLTVRNEPPVLAGGHQHQPPLGMAITDFVQRLAPDSVAAMRIPPVLASSLSALLMFRIAFALVRDTATALCLTALYATHCYVVQFGVEERPISLGLFSFLLTLELMLPVLQPSADKLRVGIAGAAAFLCVCSLGLQPPFAFAALGLALLALSPGRWRVRETARALAPLVISLLLYLPIQWLILREAPPRFNKLAHAGWADLFRALRRPYTYLVVRTFYLDCIWGALLLAAVAAAVYLGFRRGFLPMARGLRDASVWLIAAGVFLFVTSVLFEVGMDWMLMHYYVILAWPLLLLGLGHLLSLIEIPRWPGRASLAAVSLLIIALQTRGFAGDPWRGSRYEANTSDFRSSYRVLQDGRTTLLHPLCVDDGTGFCPHWLIGADFYLRDDPHVLYVGKRHSTETFWQWYRRAYVADVPCQRVALFFNDHWPEVPLPSLPDLPHLTVKHFRSITLFLVEGPDPRREAVAFMEALLASYRKKHGGEPWRLYPPLIWGHLGLGEHERALELYRQLEPPPGSEPSEALPLLATDLGEPPKPPR